MVEQNKSTELIAEYYGLHHAELKLFVMKHTSGSTESEDIVQNVFLKLLQSEKMISAITLPCLVYTVVRNLISDYWRHRSQVVRYEHYINMCACETGQVRASSVYSAFDFDTMLERSMARLTDGQRRVFCMNINSGMSVKEISLALGEKYKTVEHRLGTARKEVRVRMRRMGA